MWYKMINVRLDINLQREKIKNYRKRRNKGKWTL